MNFCVITPVGGLEKYATLSKTHLVLAHIDNPRYMKFYKERRKLGEFIILDQGAYENGQSLESDTYIKKIEWYRPHVVVLPDTYLGDAWKNHLQACQFAEKYRDWKHNLKFEWMFVPQASIGEERDWWKSIHWTDMKVHPKWIGLSRNMVADKRGTVFANPMERVLACHDLVNQGFKVHALGMANGCLPELWALHHAGCYSLDNSSPVWRGLQGKWMKDNWDGPAVDFNYDNEHHFDTCSEVIEANLTEVFKYASHTPSR